MEHTGGEVRGTDEAVKRALGKNPLPAAVVSSVDTDPYADTPKQFFLSFIL